MTIQRRAGGVSLPRDSIPCGDDIPSRRLAPRLGGLTPPARHRRRGALALETGIVLPVVVFVFLGMVVGGMGVFRYQQVACLAQEAARHASVRGADYQKYVDAASPTSAQIVAQAIAPKLAGMDPNQLTTTIEWIDNGTATATGWDAAAKDVKTTNASGEYVTSAVRVTVVYTWSPGVFFGAVQLRGVAEQPMSH